MTHHMGDTGDGTSALAQAGKLANIESCHQLLDSLTHSQQSAILRVTTFIPRLHTQTPFKISTKYTNLVKI